MTYTKLRPALLFGFTLFCPPDRAARAADLTFPYANGFEGMKTSIVYINPSDAVIVIPNPGKNGPPITMDPRQTLPIANFGGAGGHVYTVEAPAAPVKVYVQVTDYADNPMRVEALRWFNDYEQARFFNIATPDGKRSNLFISSDGEANLVVSWFGPVTDAAGNVTEKNIKSVDVTLKGNTQILHAPDGATRVFVDRKGIAVAGVKLAPWVAVLYHNEFRVVVYASEVQ
jgi:hypothetical protein